MRRNNLLLVTGRYLSYALIACGVFLLAIVGTTMLESWLSQFSGRRALGGAQGAVQSVYAAVPPAGSLGKKSPPKRFESLAILDIPRLNMSVVVLEGSDDAVLKKGPGHIEETAYPGEMGNVAIAGHRDTHFRPLRHIKLNDEIVLKAENTTMRYFIDSVKIIHPTDMEILDPTPGPALTLVTCYPFEFIGNAPMRYVIRATPRPSHAGD